MDARRADKKCILVLGGTGYLGQFLVQRLAREHKVGIVHHSTAEPSIEGDTHHFWVDLATGEGLQEAFLKLGAVDVVINCAAISSPAACERHADLARSVNVPAQLLDALVELDSKTGRNPLLIHFSTDQVYDGSKPLWKESDDCRPINVYGRTKRDAELLIQERWPNHVILRSSIIFGPQPPFPVSRLLFLQFVERTLKAGKPTKFFDDEFRSPVFVADIVKVVGALILRSELPPERTYNLGGPERLSRADMAAVVAKAWGYSTAAIEAAPSSSIQREVSSPADISMDTAKLVSEFPDVRPRRMSEALGEMLPPSASQALPP